MATSLKKFKASELAAVLGIELGRGRPSKAVRAALEADVRDEMVLDRVKVQKGALVKV